ncbi:uncharacterized protein LOC117117068 [Anneissia japonica]|uniref:uncharacterized protein LOC117117068 n=1 Tax=Anneissia japonica TaxID=1529436 RepID=UPI001425845F|nr:uncharacterized protein LOC117117068 [Anneissia japonica]
MYKTTTFVVNTFSVILVILSCRASEAVRFFHHPKDHTAVEGTRTHFTCIFREITDDMVGKYEVIWTKNHYPISEPSNGFDQNRFSFENHYEDRKHFLRIDPVMRKDAGGYRCHFRYKEVDITSDVGILTIHEVPSKKYPLVTLEKSTYSSGDVVRVRCLSEKTNPKPGLQWANNNVQLKPIESEDYTHFWIESTFIATSHLNGVRIGCKLLVESYLAPRYSESECLYITDAKPPNSQTHQKYGSCFSFNGGTRPLTYYLGVAVAQSVCASLIIIDMTNRIVI